jgi:hypothetical protein
MPVLSRHVLILIFLTYLIRMLPQNRQIFNLAIGGNRPAAEFAQAWILAGSIQAAQAVARKAKFVKGEAQIYFLQVCTDSKPANDTMKLEYLSKKLRWNNRKQNLDTSS